MRTYLNKQRHLAIIFLSLALAGCLGGRSSPTNFYMLSPLSPQAKTPLASAEDRIHIGLEAVVIAHYLNRNEIVINLDNTVYRLAEFNQWTEPLNYNLTRVLAENLTNLLRNDSIVILLAAESTIPLDYRLEVDVLRLDGNLGDQVTLIAQWALLETEEDALKLMRKSEYQAKAADDTYKEFVLAQSRTIEKLSQDIAMAIMQNLADSVKQ